jgi:hypothetical protein
MYNCPSFVIIILFWVIWLFVLLIRVFLCQKFKETKKKVMLYIYRWISFGRNDGMIVGSSVNRMYVVSEKE